MAAHWAFEAIGTQWRLDTPAELTAEVRDAITARIARYDATWSRFRDDATVAALGREPGPLPLDETARGESATLAALYHRLYRLSDGLISPLVGSSLTALGYGPAASHAGDDAVSPPPGTPRPAPRWEKSLVWDAHELSAPHPVALDIDAAGKGHLIDLVSDVLHEHGILDHVVDASGDLRHRGSGDEGRATRVALENPSRPGYALGVVEVSGEALASSAGNRRRWATVVMGDTEPDAGAEPTATHHDTTHRHITHHHIVDARTGRSHSDILATWVIADSALLADGLATALWFLPAARVRSDGDLDFEYARIHADGRIEADGRFRDAFTLLKRDRP